MDGILIIGHGSAPTTYEDVSYYINLGTKLNMAVLAFDKRGVGKSTGKYESFQVERSEEWFDLLASDIISVIEWIKSNPELNSLKIGLLGGSQAGWILPLAASHSKEVDFIIIGEGTSVSAGEEHYFSQLTGDGYGEGISIIEADKKLQKFEGARGFDPRIILNNLKVKTLWFLGTSDPVIPVDATIRVLEELDNPNFKIKILKNGNHDFVNVETGEQYNLVSFIKSWLDEENILN
jgi:dienelactone hydrolase